MPRRFLFSFTSLAGGIFMRPRGGFSPKRHVERACSLAPECSRNLRSTDRLRVMM